MNSKITKPTTDESECDTSVGRGCFKIIILLAVCAVIVGVLTQFIDEQSIDALKHNMSVWTIITLVIVINLVSFMCFTVMYFAYRWIKKDFKNKPDITDDISGTPGS